MKENLALLLKWPTAEWGPFSFPLVNKTMLLMVLVKIKSRKITDHNCKQKLFIENNINNNVLFGAQRPKLLLYWVE